ncbi:MAG: four helix bundle protein [Pyrinomonadaceae bacterium]|nr:four helix bundle protein [Pyrinomonadaceae bacterium]
MARIEKFEDIQAWKLAREVTKEVYKMSSKERFSRDFALVNQIRRASISILSNIAEGFERSGNKEFLNFLAIAKGSCGEVRSQLYVALDQQYIEEAEFREIVEKVLETSRLIGGFMKYLMHSEMRGSKFS